MPVDTVDSILRAMIAERIPTIDVQPKELSNLHFEITKNLVTDLNKLRTEFLDYQHAMMEKEYKQAKAQLKAEITKENNRLIMRLLRFFKVIK